MRTNPSFFDSSFLGGLWCPLQVCLSRRRIFRFKRYFASLLRYRGCYATLLLLASFHFKRSIFKRCSLCSAARRSTLRVRSRRAYPAFRLLRRRDEIGKNLNIRYTHAHQGRLCGPLCSLPTGLVRSSRTSLWVDEVFYEAANEVVVRLCCA